MRICIVNYGMGNIRSISNAIEFLNKTVDLISDPELLKHFDIIILPGVGAFKNAMEKLKENQMDLAIIEAAKRGKRIIGICLGMQLLFSGSDEFGYNEGLNLIEGKVVKFKENAKLRTPHMGWNNAVSKNLNFNSEGGDYYFVHSYYCIPSDKEVILFESNYGLDFCSGVLKNNHIFGFQFHPEKSQKLGLSLLEKVLN